MQLLMLSIARANKPLPDYRIVSASM